MMQFKEIPQRTAILLSALMILIGGGLLLWLLLNLPRTTPGNARTVMASAHTPNATAPNASDENQVTDTFSTTSSTHPAATSALVLGLAPGLPSELTQAISTSALAQTNLLTVSLGAA